MQEISLNILDICQNSVSAGSTEVQIAVFAKEKMLYVTITDNGKGMDESFLKEVTNPFKTSRTTRKVGLGIPLLKMAAESAEGEFSISSEVGKGTKVEASFLIESYNRMPVGDLGETLITLIALSPEVDFELSYKREEREYIFSTKSIKEQLMEVAIETPEVLQVLKEHINTNISEVDGGLIL